MLSEGSREGQQGSALSHLLLVHIPLSVFLLSLCGSYSSKGEAVFGDFKSFLTVLQAAV